MLKTAVCKILNIRYPIIQGGMAHIGTAELVSAVSNAGGLGIIGAGFYKPEWVKQQILLTRQLTEMPFGINIHIGSPYLKEVIDVILEDPPKVVATGGGNPAVIIPRFKQAGITVMTVLNDVSSAREMESAGADIIVAEGTESGGHIGKTTTMVLIPEIIENVSVPVIAAGGIFNGRGLAAALALGASGIQMGTRFICSTECIAHKNFKKAICESVTPATTITRQILGHPQRSLINSLSERFTELENSGMSVEELELFDKGRLYLGMVDGDVQEGNLLAGQAAGPIKDIKPVNDIIQEIITEAEMVISSLNNNSTED